MTEFEWSKQTQRAEAAALLRQLADGLESDGSVELEQDGWELKMSVPGELQVEVELEIDEEETELEIELKWRSSGHRAGESAASDASASAGEEGEASGGSETVVPAEKTAGNLGDIEIGGESLDP